MAIGASAPRLKLGLKDWLYDSGADHHITHDRSLFTTFEVLSGTIAAVSAPAEVKRKGTVSVTFNTEFGPRKVLITDCLTSLARLVTSSRRVKLLIRVFVNDGPLMIVKSILSGLIARSIRKLTALRPCLLCLRLRITRSLCLTTGAMIL